MADSPLPQDVQDTIAWFAGFAAVLAMIGTLCAESFIWLKTAVWPGWSIGDIFPPATSAWAGMNQIVDGVRSIPVCFFVAAATYIASGVLFMVVCETWQKIVTRKRGRL